MEYRTKSGRVLTDADIEALADEAERGYDVKQMKPVVVVVRHPDADNDIGLHGVEARVIDVDLGRSFDRRPDTDEQAREWADAVLDSVQDLPGWHPGRLAVEEVVRETCGRLPVDELAEVIRRHGGE